MAFPSTTVQMKKRIVALILAISVLGSSVIIGRLFQLQVVQAEVEPAVEVVKAAASAPSGAPSMIVMERSSP